jgi:hypothetical protein
MPRPAKTERAPFEVTDWVPDEDWNELAVQDRQDTVDDLLGDRTIFDDTGEADDGRLGRALFHAGLIGGSWKR